MSRRRGSTKNAAVGAFLGLAVAMAGGAASLGCNEDGVSVAAAEGGVTDGAAPEALAPVDAAAAAADTGTPTADAGHPVASFSSMAIDFGAVSCGASVAAAAWTVSNDGNAPLTLSAATTGAAFSVSPSTLTLGRQASGTLTLTAAVPGSATAGLPIAGALNLFTNDAANSTVSIPMSVVPTGATLAWHAGGPPIQFPSTEVGKLSAPVSYTLVNSGNAGATFDLGTPSDARFSLSQPAGGIVLAAGGTWIGTAEFTPSDMSRATATATVTATGATCGASLQSVSLAGQGAQGQVTGFPPTVDFGPVDCGGDAPPASLFVLSNSGTVDAHITLASLSGAPGFTTNAVAGRAILAGGILAISASAPPVPTPSPLTPLTATLTLQTDADASPHVITLTEEPRGAILAFDTSPTKGFGSFGPVVLLQSAMQSFNVQNTGNAPASITLTTATPPFSLSSATFSVPAGGTQADAVTFAPTATLGATGTITMAATGAVCQPLPSPVPLSGSGIGGGPTVAPTSLVFLPICGGGAPTPQIFTVSNSGSADLTWSMGDITGPGAAQYTATATPPPGLLIPGASATVTVTALALPSPVADPSPTALAAQLSITTDVPFDDPHVISLGETPLGDQLAFSVGSLRFGQIPIDTTAGQTLTVTNNANAGSPAAAVSLVVQGSGAGGYSVAPAGVMSVPAGGGISGSESLAFAPTMPVAYPATLALTTTDSLCTALPAAIPLTGTGTQGEVALSASTLTFGTDPSDPKGLVNCGDTGPSRSLTVSNVGNQPFQVTALSLGLGASSPYVLSGAGTGLPATVPIGGAVDILLVPNAIPQAVANPDDATLFADTLTITTDAALDAPHVVTLTMQARGAVIANTPLATAWTFGTIGFGSTGTFTSTLRNTGNAAVSVALEGLAQPSIFGMQNNPTLAPGGATTSIVGQFTPPSSDGSWSDQATVMVTPVEALCAPLPGPWNLPTLELSGSSNSTPAVTASGAIAFGTTLCGGAVPSGQPLTLTNQTNVSYAYTLAFNSGRDYAATDTGHGSVPANGVATIVVTPTGATFGPGAQPGSAPYADDLVVTVATSPPTRLTIPISWALNGAVLSLPLGAGPNTDGLGNAFYVADGTSGFALPMDNTGTAPATVDFAIQPAGTFTFSPASPIQVIPGIRAAPELGSTASDATCPNLTSGTVTFVYSGPVCQPFALSQVSVMACAGTF